MRDAGALITVPTGGGPGRSQAASDGTAGPRLRLDTLTGLRGLAAAIVFLPHAGLVMTGTLRQVDGVIDGAGNRALGFFFALSGFVLTWSVRPGDTARGFWQRRFARIYPAYAVTLVLAVLVTGPVQGHPLPVGPFFATLFTVQAWFPSPRWYFSYNGVDWTIAVEAFCYLVFPLLIRPLSRLGLRGRRAVQLVMLATLLVFSIAAAATSTGWLSNQFPLARLPEFVLGCTLAIDAARGSVLLRRVPLGAALLAGAAAWVFVSLPVPLLRSLPIITIPVLLLLNAGAVADLAGHRSWLTRPAVVWFGKISFCFYLVHQLVLKVVATWFVGRVYMPGQGLIWTVLSFAVAVVAAWVLHRTVEIPGNRLFRGRSRHPTPVTLQT